MIKLGLIGCGAIGKTLARDIQKYLKGRAELTAVCDSHLDKAVALVESLSLDCAVYDSYQRLVDSVDFVIEAASAHIAGDVAELALKQRKDVLVISVGGLLECEHLWDLAEKQGRMLYLPSGAIAGLDALSAAKLANIQSVSITTRKPPQGLKGAPYLEEQGIDIDSIDRETVVFEGSALDAVQAFPKNINVAATLSLAGIGAKRTLVRIVTAPEWTTNSHEVDIVSDAGRIVARTDNCPDPSNPKTSYLAALSASAVLQKHFSHVKIG